jgi:MFS family permease
VLELGVLGILGAIAFAWLAEDRPANAPITTPTRSEKMFPTPILWFLFLGACLAFSLRDFAGSSMGSLGSLFLQSAHGFSPKHTGFALSGIFVASAISNPLFGGLSDRGRIRWLCLVLSIATIAVTIFPRLPRFLLIPVFIVYGFFFMASYPMIESGLMQSVPDQVRGRVMGLFITFGGLIGNLAHWWVGSWVQHLGDRATTPSGFYSVYAGLGFLMLLSFLGLPCFHAIRRREHLQISTAAPAAANIKPKTALQ